MGISRLKRLLSQTPLRQGQPQGGLGPFPPPRTLGLPGALRPSDLGRAWLPAASAPAPRPAPSSPATAAKPRLRSPSSCPRGLPQVPAGPQAPGLAGKQVPAPAGLSTWEWEAPRGCPPAPASPQLPFSLSPLSVWSPLSQQKAWWLPALREDQARAIRLPPVGACSTQVRVQAGWGPRGAEGEE